MLLLSFLDPPLLSLHVQGGQEEEDTYSCQKTSPITAERKTQKKDPKYKHGCSAVSRVAGVAEEMDEKGDETEKEKGDDGG